MTTKKLYNIGDDAWIFGIARSNKLHKGTVISIVDLASAGFTMEHYVIKIPTEIEPLLELRTWQDISQDDNGPVGLFRDTFARSGQGPTTKKISQLGFEYDEHYEEGDPTPDEIHAAMEQSQRDTSHGPLVIKDTKPKRKHFVRKKKA